MLKKQKTIDLIIKTASNVFADVGFAGARMDEIARQAGVNKATIYYNLGNKEALYEAVLLSVFTYALEDVREKVETNPNPEEQIRLYVRAVALAFDANPSIPRIFMWEHASGGKHFPATVVEEITKVLAMLMKILKKGEETGVFRKVSPMIVQFTVVATLMFYKNSAPIRNRFDAFPKMAKDLPDDISGSIAKEFEDFILQAIIKTGD